MVQQKSPESEEEQHKPRENEESKEVGDPDQWDSLAKALTEQRQSKKRT